MHLIILREVEIFGKYFYKFYLMSKLTHLINVPFFSKGTSVAEGFGVVLYFSYIFFPLHLTPHLICNSFWLFCHGLQNRVSGG